MTFEEKIGLALAGRIEGFRHVVSSERLSGGASQETHRVVVATDGGERVLAFRRAPGGSDEGRSGPGLQVEAALMRLAGAAGVPEPEVIAVLDGSEGLGDGFLMEWLSGETLGARIVRDEAFADVRGRLAYQCGEILARIHGLDVEAAGLAARLPRWNTADYIRQLWGDYIAFETPQPMIDYAARWLLDNLPAESRTSLVHNDFRNGNLMVDPRRGVIAVLDWEVASIGDPMRDLGWLCTNSWRFGRADLPVGGFGGYDDLIAGYEAVSGLKVNREAVRYWEVFGSFWWAVGCLKMADRFRHGPDRTVERPGIGRRSSECQVDCVNLLMPGPVERELPRSAAVDENMPRTEELLVSVRDFLRGDVMAATAGRTNFLARVASNSLDIVLRELAHGEALNAREHASLKALLGTEGDLATLRWRLVNGLRDGSIALDHSGLARHLRQTVVAAVGIDQPKYSGYKTALEYSDSH